MDPRLVAVFKSDAVRILLHPSKLEVFRILDLPATQAPPSHAVYLDTFLIIGRGRTQVGPEAARVGRELLSPQLYGLPDKDGMSDFKLCGFSPGAALRFWSSEAEARGRPVDVLLCFYCDEAAVVRPSRRAIRTGRLKEAPESDLETDPGRGRLLKLVRQLLPNDAELRTLPEQND